MDDDANVAGNQTTIGKVAIQHHQIMLVDHHGHCSGTNPSERKYLALATAAKLADLSS